MSPGKGDFPQAEGGGTDGGVHCSAQADWTGGAQLPGVENTLPRAAGRSLRVAQME